VDLMPLAKQLPGQLAPLEVIEMQTIPTCLAWIFGVAFVMLLGINLFAG